MVQHQQLPHTFVADAVLAGQDQRVGEELLTDGADQLPLDVLDGDLRMEVFVTNSSQSGDQDMSWSVIKKNRTFLNKSGWKL